MFCKPNILINSLPEIVEVDGREFFIRTDYRIGILFEQLVLDPEVEDEEKTRLAIELFFGDDAPKDREQAIEAILWFYSCGNYPPKNKMLEGKTSAPPKRVYDFDYDADLIYAAFLDQYGIDMQIEDMHWWRFRALFKALKDDNKICKIIEYRSIDLSTIKNKTERARIAKLKHEHMLPCNMSEEQKVAMAGNAFAIRR